MNRYLRAFWPLALWMVLVFLMSTDVGSAEHTGRFLEPFLRWLNPSISSSAIGHVHFLIRKGGHLSEYAVLALFALRAFRILRPTPGARWSWQLAGFALGAAALYAASDEFHQRFVASRGASVHDVMIDSTGALAGLTLAFAWSRWRQKAAVSGDAGAAA